MMRLAGKIRIRPRAVFVSERSDTAAQRFAFSYEIVVENEGDQVVTLTDRRWVIDHGNGQLEEVRGEGVVGQGSSARIDSVSAGPPEEADGCARTRRCRPSTGNEPAFGPAP